MRDAVRKSTYKRWKATRTAAAIAPAAVHEAVHAVTGELIQTGIEYVEIAEKVENVQTLTRDNRLSETGMSSGYTQPKPRPLDTVEDLEKECITTWAGPVAEEYLTGKRAEDDGDRTTLVRLFKAPHLKISSDQVEPILRKTYTDTQTLIRNEATWAAIKETATLLINRKRISGDEVRAIVDRNGRARMLASLIRSPKEMPD